MKKFLSKLFIGACALLTASQLYAQATYSVFTNVTAGGPVLLYTNSAKISQIQVLAGANNVTVQLLDNNVTNLTYTNGVYTNLVTYTSNIVYQTISPLTGMTNNQTNFQLYEAMVQVPANTNNLPFLIYGAQANTMATYPINYLASRGILINPSTNCTIMVTYRVND